MICKNCRQAQEQAFNYCPNCGAEVVKARLRLGVLVRDFFYSVTNLEGPLTRTVKDLSLRTEQVTDGYINGLRKRYIGPIRYLLIVFTLTGFFTILFLDEAESNYASLYLDEYAEGYRQVMGEMSPERLGVYEERLAEVRSAINGVFSDLKK